MYRQGDFVMDSVTEFMKIWGGVGFCSLTLHCGRGMATAHLQCSLGHPGSFVFLQPSPCSPSASGKESFTHSPSAGPPVGPPAVEHALLKIKVKILN